MKFLVLFALLCTLVWVSAVAPHDHGWVKNISTKQFKKDFLRAHNEYRKRHNVPPLRMSKKLTEYAQEWAERLAIMEEIEHRFPQKYGENIYFSVSSDPNLSVSGKEPVNTWYDEIKVHTFGKEPSISDNLVSRHFTQVVWEDTKRVGVGVAKLDGRVVVVANYHPQGNILGSFVKNVHPPKP